MNRMSKTSDVCIEASYLVYSTGGRTGNYEEVAKKIARGKSRVIVFWAYSYMTTGVLQVGMEVTVALSVAMAYWYAGY